MKNNILILVLLVLIITSCKKNNSEVAKIKSDKQIDFGKIKVGDTLVKTFRLENTSESFLKIKQIKTSCGCTVAKLKDSIVKENSSTEVTVQLIAKKENIGLINKSIVIDANTENNFTVIYLKGEIES